MNTHNESATECTEDNFVLRFRLGPERRQERRPAPPYYSWTNTDGRKWAEFYRVGRNYLLRFDDLADYELSEDGLSVSAFPAPDVSRATVEHLYINQVKPLALSQQGRLVIHASSVEVNGVAVAFVANTGRGKSTLAAAITLDGHSFLGDDGLHLEKEARGFMAQPSHPSLRLWGDSKEALLPPDAPIAEPVDYTLKGRLLSAGPLRHCQRPCPIKALYLLGDGSASTPEISQLARGAATLEIIRHSFQLEPDDQTAIMAQFKRASDLAAAVPCYVFDYPRVYSELNTVVAAILEHVEHERCSLNA